MKKAISLCSALLLALLLTVPAFALAGLSRPPGREDTHSGLSSVEKQVGLCYNKHSVLII